MILEDCDQLASCAGYTVNLDGPVMVPRASLLSKEISDVVSGIRTAVRTERHLDICGT